MTLIALALYWLSVLIAAATTIFAALGDPTRAAIVERLIGGGPTSVTNLSSGLPVTRQAVTKHLRVLTKAGLVRSERQGREQVVELDTWPLFRASTWLEQLAGQWDQRLATLKKAAEKK